MARGFSVDHLISVFQQTPKNHEFVIKVNRDMYVVKDLSLSEITVRRLDGLKIDSKELKSDPPQNVMLYWYFPFTQGQLILANLSTENLDTETDQKPKGKKKTAKSSLG